MTLLRMNDVGMRLGELRLLDGISLEVAEGETVAIVGESGSGKSLTARIALGLFPDRVQMSGSALLDGVEMIGASPSVLRRQRSTVASMIFQDPRSGINPLRRVGDFLTESLRNTGVAATEASGRARRLLASVGLPDTDETLHRHPHEFSGGMLQRIMIAAALSTEPRLLLCDEPTTALDVTTQAEIISILREQKAARRMGMLFITHDLNLASDFCDRVYVMKAGRFLEDGPVRRVFGQPSAEYTKALLAATPSLDGPTPARTQERSAPESEPVPIVKVTGISKRYRLGTTDVQALDDVSFTVQRGESLGIVGESGSGKSTIARMLVALEAPDSGEIVVDGLTIGRRRRLRSAERLLRARSTQIVFQDPYLSLDPRIPVGAAIADMIRLHDQGRGVDVASRVADLLSDVGLAPNMARLVPRALSGGQRQRVAIAKALAVEPELLVLDEATSALDVSVQAQLLETLRRIRAERSLSMVFVSHNLAVIRETCERTLVLKSGRVIEQGETARMLRAPVEAYTRQLIAAVPRDYWAAERPPA
ncbi:dipeptide ABC transporter ATP-binding protein [uncultured Microbacterium sp.]|uniref:dipeptide ABC transporter ATP-binding protein n=1 Tax=uncultured Microbacterium sp. TaxID=191216 RepID=UPI0035CB2A1D